MKTKNFIEKGDTKDLLEISETVNEILNSLTIEEKIDKILRMMIGKQVKDCPKRINVLFKFLKIKL